MNIKEYFIFECYKLIYLYKRNITEITRMNEFKIQYVYLFDFTFQLK